MPEGPLVETLGKPRNIVGVLLAAIMVMSGCGGVNDATPSNSRPTQTDDSRSEPETGTPTSTDAAPSDRDRDADSDTGTDSRVGVERAGSEARDAEETETAVGAEIGSSDSPPDPLVAALGPVGPGDSGEEVLALQEHLAKIGFGPGTPDGEYGNKTVAAVSAFQQFNGMTETGEVDRRTLDALGQFRYDGLIVRAGDEGSEVEELQHRLAGGPFDPGPTDGEYGQATVQAVWALEKLAGIPVDGDWGPLDEQAWTDLQDGKIGRPEKSNDQRWVEVDLSQQLAKIYDPNEETPTLVVHISSGSGVPWSNEDHSGSSITPLGDFHIERRISGWRESSLNIGSLYNPLYFNGGIAFHGANSVPLYPASHGCVRVPLHIADYLPGELPNGTPVHILT